MTIVRNTGSQFTDYACAQCLMSTKLVYTVHTARFTVHAGGEQRAGVKLSESWDHTHLA